VTISSIVPCSGTGSCSRNEFEARENSDLAPVLPRQVALPSLSASSMPELQAAKTEHWGGRL
jgi:hypothetical protein